MHDAAFAALGLGVRYRALDVPPEALVAAVAGLRRPDVIGANVSIPHKRSVMELLDALTPVARAVGAVNTITPRGGGLEGHNTDVEGFLEGLRELGVGIAGARVLVLGAGGAARAVVYGLAGGGARVTLHNRGAERARDLARDMTAVGEVRCVEAAALPAAVAACDLVVNATSVGMQGGAAGAGASPLPDGVLPEHGAVVDLVYRPAETLLLRRAREAGRPTQNGLAMLVHQGAAAFSRWTGLPAPVEVMRRAALAVLGTHG